MNGATDKRTSVLVTLADAAYVEQAKQLFSSAYHNSGWKGDYLLLARAIPPAKLEWFKRKGILVHECDPVTEAKIGRKHHPPTVFDKLYLFKEYFKRWDKVVFLDSDIIVRASLDGLVETAGFRAPDATSLDLRGEFHAADPALFAELQKDYPLEGPAFNTGVFAFDTSVIGPETFSLAVSLMRRFGPLSLNGEEGIINLLFYRRWTMLPMVYNIYPFYMGSDYGIKPRDVRGIVLHFVFPNKPWQPHNPFYEEWARSSKLAESIDLSSRKAAAERWDEREIEGCLARLRRRQLAHRPLKMVFSVDRWCGRFGLFMKKRHPGLYWRLHDRFTLPLLASRARRDFSIQMGVPEIAEIMRSLRPPLNLLVFGLGNDSAFWTDFNEGGRTAFIEDDPDWLERMRLAYGGMEAHPVEYGTKRSQWRELIDDPEKLALPLPDAVIATAWDAVIVDAPAGYRDDSPGRMKSIFMASRLVRPGGQVFVHDAEREAEAAYSDKYLGRENLANEVKGRSVLRRYRLS